MKIVDIDRDGDIVTFTLKKKMKLGEEISMELFYDLMHSKQFYEKGEIHKATDGKYYIFEFEFSEKEDKTFSIEKIATPININND